MNHVEQDNLNDIYDLDWNRLTQLEKKSVIDQQIKYIKLSRSVVGATSSYSANIRSLFLVLFVVMLMALAKFDNKVIIMTFIFLQFVKTLLTRIFQVSLTNSLELTKLEMSNFITKIMRNKNG